MHGKHPRAPGRWTWSTRIPAVEFSSAFVSVAKGKRVPWETDLLGPAGSQDLLLPARLRCSHTWLPGPHTVPAQASFLHRSQTPDALGLGEKLAHLPACTFTTAPPLSKAPGWGVPAKGSWPGRTPPRAAALPRPRCRLASRPARERAAPTCAGEPGAGRGAKRGRRAEGAAAVPERRGPWARPRSPARVLQPPSC